MITILKGTIAEVHWRIIRTANKISEDFTGAVLKIFLAGPDNVYSTSYDIVSVDGYNEIHLSVDSSTLSTGVYDLKAVWIKNKNSIPDVVNNQFMSVSRRGGVLAVTNDPSEVTLLPLDNTIKVMSYVESYGRDGMSAYELAAFRGVLPEGMSEVEWANQENVRQQNEEKRIEAENERREAEDYREAYEHARKEQEDVRVKNENDRKAAETTRQATFTANEDERQSTFDTNEANREAEFDAAIQSAKDNLIVVNDLTTGGADKALSAEMGKELGYREYNTEYARAYVDADGRFLWGIKLDGSIEFAKGVPTPIKKYIESIDRDNDEEIARINQLVAGLIADVNVLTDTYQYISNSEWAQVTIDNEGRIIEGVLKDGKKYFPKQDMLEKYNDVEGRLELTLDQDNSILSCRRKDGTKYEAKLHVGNHFSLGEGAMSDLQRDLRASGFNVDNPVDWSAESSISLPIPRYCAKVNIISDTGLATTKTQDKKCVLEYWDKSGNYFKKYIILNAQGSSSMAYIEKNQSIDIFNDEDCEESCDIVFGNWISQDSFHLKCYYIDVFRGINNVCYNYCEEVIKYLNCRSNRILFDKSSITSSNSTGDFNVDFGDDALCHPDGFPFEMYVNGEYYGLFAWNLKKHRKNYSMGKNDATKTLLDGVIDEVTFFGGTIDWTRFELRNPKDLVCTDGTEYDADTNCKELIDEDCELYDSTNEAHVNSAAVKKIVERQSQAIGLISAETDVETARSIYEQYYDVDAMNCFFIISNVIYNYDGFRKNWLWTIYDKIAAPNFYDLDTVFGRHWNGTCVVGNSIVDIIGTTAGLPTEQLVRLYKTELDATYKRLRDDKLIDVDYIMMFVYDWMKWIGNVAYKKNIEAWPSTPSYRSEKNQDDGTYDGGMFDSPKRIEIWLSKRIETLDNYFNYN